MSRAYTDLKDRVFGKLTVIEVTNKRARKSGSVIWKCECECGKVIDAAANNLLSDNTKACGCMKDIENADKVRDSFHVENTNLLSLTSKKYKNNSSGYKGVYKNNKSGIWQAYISVNKRRIHLGSYKSIEEAIQARVKAEQIYHKPIIDKYANKLI